MHRHQGHVKVGIEAAFRSPLPKYRLQEWEARVRESQLKAKYPREQNPYKATNKTGNEKLFGYGFVVLAENVLGPEVFVMVMLVIVVQTTFHAMRHRYGFRVRCHKLMNFELISQVEPGQVEAGVVGRLAFADGARPHTPASFLR